MEESTFKQTPSIDSKIWSRSAAEGQAVYLWQITKSFLFTDDLDETFMEITGKDAQEIIFLSRHAASSGRPSLTIHTIGTPGKDPNSPAEHGGKTGKCVAPSPRIAPMFRILHRSVKDAGLLNEDNFEVTLEATHHGPYHAVPTMFVEIGSTEEHWGRDDAASLWADVLDECLGLGLSSSSSSSSRSPTGPVVIGK